MNKNFMRGIPFGVFSNASFPYIAGNKVFRQKTIKKEHLTQLRVIGVQHISKNMWR